jgi:predicted ATPase
MPSYDKWYVITGGPSTGKTTLQAEMAKLGYKTVEEAARLEIDDAVSRGITVEEFREDEKRFQDEVVRRRVKLEAQVPKDEVVFLDRGMQDSLAYYRYYDFDIEPWVFDFIKDTTYGKVFLMEPLGIYKQDYARTEVRDFNDYISDLLYDAYVEYGMQPVRVPPVSVEERVKIVLEHVKADSH